MPEQIQLPPRDVPVVLDCDICVVGAGAAGVAAAVAAGRLGLSVVLVERYGFCGGATVAGLSGTICGLFSSGDDPVQIVHGFAGEFYEHLRARNGAARPFTFGRTKLVPHDSFVWKEVADDLLEAAGVTVLFHTVLADVVRADDGRCTALILLAKEGFVAVKAQCVIDASGDAEVVHRLGHPTTLGQRGVVQAATMVFRVGGVDMRRFEEMELAAVQQQIAAAAASGRYNLPRDHVYLFPMPNDREVLCNMTRVTFPDGSVPLGVRSADLSFAERAGRQQVRAYATFLRENVDAFRDSYLVESGAQIGIRQTRSIVGRTRLANEDVVGARKSPGAVTYSAWPIELHEATGVRIVYLDDRTYDVPFDTLVPASTANVIVAGRCLSADNEALASARVTAQCFGMGYAAGAAGGLLVREQLTFGKISGVAVREWMLARGLCPPDRSAV
jgi:hypothetical protein